MKCSQYELSNNIYYFLFDICIHHAECLFLNNMSMTKNLNSIKNVWTNFLKWNKFYLISSTNHDTSISFMFGHVTNVGIISNVHYIIIIINFTIETWFIWIMYMFSCTPRYMYMLTLWNEGSTKKVYVELYFSHTCTLFHNGLQPQTCIYT